MTSEAGSLGDTTKLRRRAEEIAAGRSTQIPDDGEAGLSDAARRTLHELRVHQIELELQNEELRRAQAELELARARYFDLYDMAPVGYCTLSEQGQILEANLTAATLLGRPRADLARQPITRFILVEDQDIYYLHRKALFDTGDPQECDLRLVRRDDTLFWAHLAARTAQDDNGAPLSRVVLSDITERKRQEDERELTARLISLVSTPGDFREQMRRFMTSLQGWSGCEAVGVRLRSGEDYPYYETHGFPPAFVQKESRLCAYGADGRILRDGAGSPVLECMCGDVLCGRTDPALPFFTARGSFWTNSTTALLAAMTESDRPARTLNRCHGEGYESVALVPLRAGGEALGLLQLNDRGAGRFSPSLIAQLEGLADSLAIALARRRSEEAFQASEQQVKGLLEQQIAINQLALALGESLDLTKVYRTIHEHIRGMMDVWRLIVSSYDDQAKLIRAEYAAGEEEHDVTAFPPIPLGAPDTGTQSRVIHSGQPLYTPDHRAALRQTVESDISVHEELPTEAGQEDTTRSVVYLPMKLKGKPVGVLQVRSRRLDAYRPDQISLLAGIANVAAVAVQNARLLAEVQAQARQIAQLMDAVPEGVLLLDPEGMVLLANPTGERDLADLAACSIGDRIIHLGDRPLAELLAKPDRGGLWHEIRAGGRVYEAIARPIGDGGAAGGHAVLVLNDVTEAHRIRAEYQQQEQLAAVGRLAAGIAHDFNNILAIIALQASLAANSPGLPEPEGERLGVISRQADHAARLVQQLLDFSRRAVLERLPLDLGLLLAEQAKLLRRTLPENIVVTLIRDGGEHVVLADPTRLQQMLMNLAVNARDAMPLGGSLRLTLSRLDAPPRPEMSAGDWVRLEVADSGTGLRPEAQAHLFEPFFTTKPRGEGTGLGLAQVHGIVKQHEGEIEVDSAPGRGTTFVIYLPALTAVAPQVALPEAPAPEGVGQAILIVEDNEALLEALRDIVEVLGYSTMGARDGVEGLAVLEARRDGIALVLSDLMMPVMGGQALLEAIRERGLRVPVVVLSGYALEGELAELKAKGLAGWLLKPPRVDELARVIGQTLHSARPSQG